MVIDLMDRLGVREHNQPRAGFRSRYTTVIRLNGAREVTQFRVCNEDLFMKKHEEEYLKTISPEKVAQVMLHQNGDVLQKPRVGGLRAEKLPRGVKTPEMVKLLESISEPNKNRHPAQGIRYGRINGLVDGYILDWTADMECTNVTIIFEAIRS